MILAIPIISLLLSGQWFQGDIAQLATGKENLYNWLESLEVPEYQLGDFNQLDFMTTNKQLDNSQPKYTGKKIFDISVSSKPSTTLYLRGFCADTYTNGTWKWDKAIFSEACEEAGYSENEIARLISYQPYYVVLQQGGSATYNTFELTYVGTTGNTAYLPYVFNYGSLDGDYVFKGDELPEDYVCPLCGVGIEHFEEIED